MATKDEGSCAHCNRPVTRSHRRFSDPHGRVFHSVCWIFVHSKRKDFAYVREAERNGCPHCHRSVHHLTGWYFFKGAYYHNECGRPLNQPKLIGGAK